MVGCLPSELEMDVEVWNSRSALHRIHGVEWRKLCKFLDIFPIDWNCAWQSLSSAGPITRHYGPTRRHRLTA
jgi:hypothetical protein